MLGVSLTINQFAKTPEGMSLIAAQKPFVLGGVIFQGYNGQPATCYEKTMLPEEIDAATDVDGTKDKVYLMRKQREGGRHDRKAREYRDRRAELRKQRNDILEAMEKSEKRGVPPSPADLEDIEEIDGRMARLSMIAVGFRAASGGIKAPRTDTEVALVAAQEQLPGFNPDHFSTPEEALRAAKTLMSAQATGQSLPTPPVPASAAVGDSEAEILKQAGIDPSIFGGPEEAAQVARALKGNVSTAPEPGPEPPETQPDPHAVIEDLRQMNMAPTKCDVCEKQSPPDSKNPVRWLRSHRVGAHTPRRKRGDRQQEG